MRVRSLLSVASCIIWLLGSYSMAVASGGIATVGPNGEKYKVEFYGSLIVGPDRLLGNAMMQGKGQYYLAAQKILVTSGRVKEISNKLLAIQINGENKVFKLTKATKICNGRNSLKSLDLQKGEMVTVTSYVGQQIALSVRKGPMLFKGLMQPPLQLKEYKCE